MDGVLGYWLHPGPVQVIMAIWGTNQKVENLPFMSFFLYYSVFQINISFIKERLFLYKIIFKSTQVRDFQKAHEIHTRKNLNIFQNILTHK